MASTPDSSSPRRGAARSASDTAPGLPGQVALAQARQGRRGRVLALAITILALPLLQACAGTTGITREEVIERYDAVGSLAAQLNAASDAGLPVLAPRGFDSAQQSLDQAVASAQEGNEAEAERVALAGLERLARARENSARTSEALREALASRQRAIDAGAPTLLVDRFDALEDEFREAAQLAERGNLESAKESGPDLLRGYSGLELDALKTDATDLARAAIADARKAEADRYAPETFGRAKKELSIAEEILETDRSRMQQANTHARRASELAARSQYLSEMVKEFDRRDYEWEQALLWYQEQVEDLTSPLDPAISFTKPNHEAIAETRERLAALVRLHAESQAELADAKGRIELLELTSTASREELESQLARVKERQRAAEARYARVSSMFTDDEAEVYRKGSDVLLTTYGFDFPVGESEIRSSNFPLLNKIARAIEEFDRPKVVVSGHTDATGSDETNLKLSEERASKVGAFLVQIGELGSDRVTTRGFGETKPVATNETEEGRAKNRRIEILIVNDRPEVD